jgi:hypothetical protein
MTQMTLTDYNHMIEALTSDRADQTFGIAVLPGRSRRCRSVANAHRFAREVPALAAAGRQGLSLAKRAISAKILVQAGCSARLDAKYRFSYSSAGGMVSARKFTCCGSGKT